MTILHTPLPAPGLLWGDYPERRPPQAVWLEGLARALRDAGDRIADVAQAIGPGRDARWLRCVQAAKQWWSARAEPDALAEVRAMLRRRAFDAEARTQALAFVALAAERHLGMVPFDTQLIAAQAVLDHRLAEMATGEGKTLAVALAAAVGALAGMPVHVITANDYLVARDAERMQPLAQALQLSVGAVVQSDAAGARARAYACDIAFVTAKELVFDYLRDGLGGHQDGSSRRRRRDAPAVALQRLHGGAPRAPALLRGLCMAIVDEADSILVDEARVPLILALPADPLAAQAHAQQVLRYAATLREGSDFRLNAEAQQATLTEHGQARLRRAADSLAQSSATPAWRHAQHREHAVVTALAALHLFRRDRHYLVRYGKVQIVDETTGRVAEGRVWSDGLQQLVEVKEGCAPTPPTATAAQLTYQRFFPRYLRLGGLSGTLCESRGELMRTYGLSVRRVPLRRPCLRRVEAHRLWPDHEALRDAVAERVAQLHGAGRPVLVAADTVADAQAISEQLAARGLAHDLLHARNDHAEAEIVARAGQRSAITVTTNISGRGTDIALGPDVAELGGLHVLSCQLNGARRIDRQLAGRAARQGDPGSVQTMLSLDTGLLARATPSTLRRALRACAPALPGWTVRALARQAQRAEERRQREQRRRLVEQDERIERQLGFAGAAE